MATDTDAEPALDVPTFRLPPKERAKAFAARYAERPALTPEQDAILIASWDAYDVERKERRARERAIWKKRMHG